MKGVKNGLLILSCLGILYLGTRTVFAGEYVLDTGYPKATLSDGQNDVTREILDSMSGDDEDFWEWQDSEEEELNEVATASEATPSYLSPGVTVMNYYGDVFDGSISSTQVTYFTGIVSRFPPSMHYVFFRQSQYEYRLVYSPDLGFDGSVFTAPDAEYVLYNTRDNYVSQGMEGSFSLTPRSYPVYTDLDSKYPILGGVKQYENKAFLFMLAFGILVNFVLGFFGSSRYRW